MMPDPDAMTLPDALPALNDPALYLNRELSWLAFNERVLGEARDRTQPLLERVKFVAITHSNLDEYYMVRVSGLQQQVTMGMTDVSPDGMTSAEQLTHLRGQVGPMLNEAASLFCEELLPELKRVGIEICDFADLSRAQQKALRAYFERGIFPVLTPLALGPGHPFPHISNLSLNLAVVVRDPELGERFARMKVPGVLPRFVPCARRRGKRQAMFCLAGTGHRRQSRCALSRPASAGKLPLPGHARCRSGNSGG